MSDKTHAGPPAAAPFPRDHNEGPRFKGRWLEIEYLSPDSLALNPRNPRKHSPKQIKQLIRSIRRFGFTG